MEKGMEKGIKKGMEKGIKKGMEESALKGLKEGLPVDLIIKLTNLTKEEIENLKEKN